MIRRVHRLLLVVFAALCLPLPAHGQEPIDLFSDAPPLAEGYVRLATWNLRHINVEGQAANYIPGANYQEDLEILVATFAKAIEDLGLDVVALVEHVPRADDPLQKIVAALNNGDAGPWRSDETDIEYDEDAHHNLQLAVLWNSDRVTINPDDNELLLQLRQPRNAADEVEPKTMRAPWKVPVRVGDLECDLLVLHLKSGGAYPQAREVEALQGYIRQHQAGQPPRHLIVLGDWNMRPDTNNYGGRTRIEAMMVPTDGTDLMRVLMEIGVPNGPEAGENRR